MNKKIKFILIILITLIVGVVAYSQVLPVIIEKPKKDFTPILLEEANDSQDNNMTLSFLYNITKEKHPTGSKEIYKVKDYIVECLEQMKVNYKVHTEELNAQFFSELKQRAKQRVLKTKSDFYENIKEKVKDGDVEEFIREQTEFNSFDEFYKTTLNGIDEQKLEEKLEEIYKEQAEKYKNEILNNIIVKMNSNDNPNAKNIMFVAHYDCGEQSYGAGDNGVSVAGLLETIRCLKENKFSNNIYVMFTDGEEKRFWGAYDFIQKNDIKFDLMINFDNSGNSGNLILYHYSSDYLTKQYFKAVKNEASYSFVNDLLYNPNSEYYQGERSDAFIFVENGYNTIDLALVGNSINYHTEEDNFYNIDIKSLENLTKTMMEMMSYFGNNKIELNEGNKLFNFKLLNGLEICINQSTYIIISIVSIVFCCIYICVLFVKKKKLIQKILGISFTAVSIITLSLFKNFSLLFSLPCVIIFILDFIKNEKLKQILKIILFEIYFFVVFQLIILIAQYSIWPGK